MKSKVNILGICIFYALAILIRYLTNKTELLNSISNEYVKIIIQGIGPAVGAAVALLLFKDKLKLSLRGNFHTIITPFALYWLLPIVVISTVSYLSKGAVPILTVTSILLYGLLEEIGWRGYLQQELSPLPKVLNILIVATLWFLWHLNFELSTSNLLFFGILILGSWGIGKVADKTLSLLAVSGFHALNNFFSDLNTAKIIIIVFLVSVWVISIIKTKKKVEENKLFLNDI